MPYFYQCQLSWLKLSTDSRPTLADSCCQSCQNIQRLTKEIFQNFSYLAETGYAEGVICHSLVKGLDQEKQAIAVGIPIIIRCCNNPFMFYPTGGGQVSSIAQWSSKFASGPCCPEFKPWLQFFSYVAVLTDSTKLIRWTKLK